MSLADISNIASVLGALSLMASVYLLFRELREANRLTRASNNQALVGLSSPFYLGILQDRKIAELYAHGARNFGTLDEIDQYRYKTLLLWWLVFHENAFFQWRKGLLDDNSYKPWSAELQSFVQQQDLASRWEELRSLFQDKFARHVQHVIDEERVAHAAADGPSGSQHHS